MGREVRWSWFSLLSLWDTGIAMLGQEEWFLKYHFSLNFPHFSVGTVIQRSAEFCWLMRCSALIWSHRWGRWGFSIVFKFSGPVLAYSISGSSWRIACSAQHGKRRMQAWRSGGAELRLRLDLLTNWSGALWSHWFQGSVTAPFLWWFL